MPLVSEIGRIRVVRRLHFAVRRVFATPLEVRKGIHHRGVQGEEGGFSENSFASLINRRGRAHWLRLRRSAPLR